MSKSKRESLKRVEMNTTMDENVMKMNQQLFTMALGLTEPWYAESLDFKPEERRLDIWIAHTKGALFKCPICGKLCGVRDHNTKEWRHLDFFQHECHLHAEVPRIECPEHGVKLVEVPWGRPGSHFTLLFEQFALLLAKNMPVAAAAKILRIGDKSLFRIIMAYVNMAREKEDYSNVQHVGMDETSVKAHHDYVSFFVDLDKRRILFGTKGNGSETLKEFVEDFEAHGGEAEKISEVACDLNGGFLKGVREELPNAQVTYDRFHFIKMINEAVDTVRREECKENAALRGSKYLFLKNPENLTENQSAKLKPLCSETLKTGRAYQLKLSLMDVYKCFDYESALAHLEEWSQWARRSQLKPFIRLAKSVTKNAALIARWHLTHLTTGIMEGINSLIQAAKNKARGVQKPTKLYFYGLPPFR